MKISLRPSPQQLFFTLVVGCFILRILIYCLWRTLLAIKGFVIKAYRMRLAYPIILRQFTRMDLIFLIFLCTVNGCAMGVGVSTVKQFRQRCAQLALISLASLSISEQILNICGLSSANFRMLHNCVGAITVLQAILHASLRPLGRSSNLPVDKVHWIITVCAQLRTNRYRYTHNMLMAGPCFRMHSSTNCTGLSLGIRL